MACLIHSQPFEPTGSAFPGGFSSQCAHSKPELSLGKSWLKERPRASSGQPLPVFSWKQAGPLTPQGTGSGLRPPVELFAIPAQLAAIPEGPRQPQHFLLRQAFGSRPSCRDSQWLPGGTSPDPSWADPDKVDGAAHSLDLREAAGQLHSWKEGDHPLSLEEGGQRV